MTASHLGHVHLRVGDADLAPEFYAELLELSIVELIGRYRFLSFGEHYHDRAQIPHDPNDF